MKGINKRIEELRKQLNELVDGIDSCGEEKILEVSQELDKVIYEYIKKKLKY
ncbi:aspartyl-phosphate phosphatase Spo0E family protein [Alkaliphilus flagellatus]|uniref:aspartyl-phosphate phosphatase Spo0E family protein n=1 Tax=Alkaliphilus flagellatus TaxID=2841507 RepID=UPI001FE2E129|nr:aspartyl-phosphate phosphatase Spo0E family protein [Alkaliphilus flagellatus]